MGLFDDGTVIIVGAGASVPFGLPTGIDMFDEVVKVLKDELQYCKPPSVQPSIEGAPFWHAVDMDSTVFNDLSGIALTSRLEKLSKELQSQTSDTIDDFIVQNPSEADICKALVGWTLLRSLLEPDRGAFKMGDFFGRMLPFRKPRRPLPKEFVEPMPRRNWVQQFINLAREQFKDREIGSKIKIVNFNYDGILEIILQNQWNNVKITNRDYGDWRECFEIVHPHGYIEFPNIGKIGLVPKDLFQSLLGKIYVTREGSVDPAVDKMRLRAKEMMENSREVFAIGFAFARSNCELIGLNENFFLYDGRGRENRRLLRYLNFDGSYGLTSRVQKYCAELLYNVSPADRVEFKPDIGDRLHIDDALTAGFLGEMPS